jgi:hypothetical protein
MFLTTPEFLPQHRAHHQQTLQLISSATAAGRTRLAEMNQQVADNLEKIITSLAADPDHQQDPPKHPTNLPADQSRRTGSNQAIRERAGALTRTGSPSPESETATRCTPALSTPPSAAAESVCATLTAATNRTGHRVDRRPRPVASPLPDA